MSRTFMLALCALAATCALSSTASAAGTLTPTGDGDQPIRIVDHHVEVVIHNGFARTEVVQVFENPNAETIEGIYTLPLPLSAALSEMTVVTDTETLYGEVISRAIAEEIYAERRAAGEGAALATKEGFQRFEFRIANIPANSRVSMTFAYYQPQSLDDGVGRYVYPLEEGGTDDAFGAPVPNDAVDGALTAHVMIYSDWPIDSPQLVGLEDDTTVTGVDARTWELSLSTGADLNRDLVLYYELAKERAAQLDVVTYRPDPTQPGTFMMLVTPGTDLDRLVGADYVFVLDVSTSMSSKLPTLIEAVVEAIGSLWQDDRFRVVAFSDSARELTTDWVGGRSAQVDDVVAQVRSLDVVGGTSVSAGLELALQNVDPERATGIVLVTDGVANEGIVDGPGFVDLVADADVRIFGLLMGNSGNWPLLELLTRTTSGFYSQVSNEADIQGEILRARNKVTHEAMHDVEVSIAGGETFDLTPVPGTVHYGEQVVMFGHYEGSGPVRIDVNAEVTGRPESYGANVELPAESHDYPELERLWALERTRWLEYQYSMELIDRESVRAEVLDIGVRYQIVTDETAMILLPEEAFERYGIDRNNRDRVLTEAEARGLRDQALALNQDGADGRGGSAAGPGPSGFGSGYGGSSGDYGGGAVDGHDLAWLAGFLGLAALLRTRRRRTRR